MEYGISIYREGCPDAHFVNKLLYLLVAEGVAYDQRTFSLNGAYMIIGDGQNKDIHHTEKSSADTTKLAEIVEQYRTFTSKDPSITLYLDCPGEHPFFFVVAVIPEEEKTLLKFMLRMESDEQSYIAFIDLCAKVFVQFDCEYGAYWDERAYSAVSDHTDPPETRVTPITFYSEAMVEAIGRDRLLSAPAQEIRELDDGGVLLIASLDRSGGGCPEVEDIKQHFSSYDS